MKNIFLISVLRLDGAMRFIGGNNPIMFESYEAAQSHIETEMPQTDASFPNTCFQICKFTDVSGEIETRQAIAKIAETNKEKLEKAKTLTKEALSVLESVLENSENLFTQSVESAKDAINEALDYIDESLR